MYENEKAEAMTAFSVIERRVDCPHKFQLYVDYGTTKGGPWLKIGVNETEFGLGYLPRTHNVADLKVASPEAT